MTYRQLLITGMMKVYILIQQSIIVYMTLYCTYIIGASQEEPLLSDQLDSTPLYEGSQITAGEAIIALLSLASKHKLTYTCINDVLRLMSLLLPMPNGLTISVHQLLGKFVNFKKETIVHKFCGNCSVPLQDGIKCTKVACSSVRQLDTTFIEIHLDNQIKEKMEG